VLGEGNLANIPDGKSRVEVVLAAPDVKNIVYRNGG